MVNTQDKGQDYYPQSKQGEREGKPEVYSRNAQLPSAPDQTSSTLKYHMFTVILHLLSFQNIANTALFSLIFSQTN